LIGKENTLQESSLSLSNHGRGENGMGYVPVPPARAVYAEFDAAIVDASTGEKPVQ
jgi:hypothetical protein